MEKEEVATSWPLCAGLGPLGVLPTAGRLCRGFVVLVLAGWRLPGLADDCELVTGELVANVVQAATGPDGQSAYDRAGRLPVLWLRLLSDGVRVQVEVWDQLPGRPAPRTADNDDESGRGLEMVQALSIDWGWDQLPDRDTKRVWALVAGKEAE